jgi:hypothetical protein
MPASVPCSSVYDDIRGDCGCCGGKVIVREGRLQSQIECPLAPTPLHSETDEQFMT